MVSPPPPSSLLYNNPFLLFINSFNNINDDYGCYCIDNPFICSSSSLFSSYPTIIFIISNIDDDID